jgi:hypothetical protein
MKKGLLALMVLLSLVATASGCGAQRTAAGGPPMCTVGRLHSQFWTTMPYNMAGVFSGLTITNGGGRCTLPLQVSSARAEAANGSFLRPPGYTVPKRLPDAAAQYDQHPTARHPVPEFAAMSLNKAAPASFAGIYSAFARSTTTVRSLVLSRGEKAELVLQIWTPVTNVDNCLSVPKGGAMALGIGNQVLRARVPVMPAPSGGPFNRTGSAFWECSTTLAVTVPQRTDAGKVALGTPEQGTRAPLYPRGSGRAFCTPGW